MLAWQYCLIKSNLKCVWHKILYLLVRKSFQNDGERGLFYRDCSLCCRVIQGFDLCKLDYLWRHMVDTKWCKITRNGTSLKHFCIELKLLEFLYSLPTAMIWPIVTFPWQCNVLWSLSIQRVKSEFPYPIRVICSWCSLSGCERIWTLNITSTRKSVRLWSDKERHFSFRKGRGLVTSMLLWWHHNH